MKRKLALCLAAFVGLLAGYIWLTFWISAREQQLYQEAEDRYWRVQIV